jgi:phosphoribosylcarboxyaminoimidazole (NCAIR) mutase
MTVETNPQYPSDWNPTLPAAGDPKSEGDDHIRNNKVVWQTTFPGLTGAVTASQAELNILDGATLSTAELNILDGVTASAAELNTMDGITASTAELNIMDGVTATAGELNALDGITATVTELNYTDGVTSPIQTQLDSLNTLKAPKASPALTGVPTAPTALVGTSTDQIATTAFVAAQILETELPGQLGNSGKFVTTDGTNASWATPTGLQVSNTPAGSIAATTVQAAINELDTEKQSVLVSGTSIKTIDGTSLLGAGDITRSPGDHAIKVTTGNGYGSTNTQIRRYTTTLISTGSQVVYADSAANGASFTIQAGGDGLWELSVKDFHSGSSCLVGISLNSAELTTAIDSITAANRLISAALTTGNTPSMTLTVRLVAGDIVRPHMGATLPDGNTAVRSSFTIRKVGL